ncbi:hypothetical protein GOBAR_DD07634 [Gossypium barbadense]|nr:hypothetical protein GOBAR_DD07634 [Gossypium barbadense]
MCHEAKEESHASSMDDTRDEFVSNTDNFDIQMDPGMDEAAYFHNLNFTLHRILRAISRVQPTPLAPPPPVVLQNTPIKRFYRCKAGDFYGTNKDDPIATDQWLRDILRTLSPLYFTPDEQPTWDQLLSEFRRKYIGQAHIDDLRMQFSRLFQDSPKVFSKLVRQANAIKRILGMRLSSSDESSIQKIKF